jgi:phage shock protein A
MEIDEKIIKELIEAIKDLTYSVDELRFKQESIIEQHPQMTDSLKNLESKIGKLTEKIK